jgi:hypothetical protein
LHTAFAVMPSGKLKMAREILRNLIVSAALKLSAKIVVRMGGMCVISRWIRMFSWLDNEEVKRWGCEEVSGIVMAFLFFLLPRGLSSFSCLSVRAKKARKPEGSFQQAGFVGSNA